MKFNKKNKETVAVIIPFYNGLKYTKMCIHSIFKYTQHPYKLILVDNGSGEAVKKYLNEAVGTMNNGKIIYNSKNMGAPKAFNQGIASSGSKYLLFLNNDTIVTEGWLGRLIEYIKADNQIGAVGACSNKVRNNCGDFPNREGYRNEAEIHKTAAFTSLTRKGEFKIVPAVTSFCMLTKREVIDRVGVFDENYGLGTNDDHDFCLRARLEGYKIACAFNSFVFHFYNKTLGKFRLAELDRRNREYFVWKHRERGLKFYEEIKQPYGTRGERPFEEIKKLESFA